MKLFRVIESLASEYHLKFPNSNGANELVQHYTMTWKSLTGLGSSLKESTRKEKLEKDELNLKDDRAKRAR